MIHYDGHTEFPFLPTLLCIRQFCIDAASGGSDDWVKGVAGIKFAYTLELPDRGDFGFLLPASEILPVGQVRC